jgi:hypothetical protein
MYSECTAGHTHEQHSISELSRPTATLRIGKHRRTCAPATSGRAPSVDGLPAQGGGELGNDCGEGHALWSHSLAHCGAP